MAHIPINSFLLTGGFLNTGRPFTLRADVAFLINDGPALILGMTKDLFCLFSSTYYNFAEAFSH